MLLLLLSGNIVCGMKDYCSQLQELDVSAGVVKFGGQLDVDKLQRGCPQLRVLRMMNCNLTPTNTTADYKVRCTSDHSRSFLH